MNTIEASKIINSFLSGENGEWEWDDFISIRDADPLIQRVKNYCNSIPVKFPSTSSKSYCSDEGLDELAALSEILKHGEENVESWLIKRSA